MRLHFRHFRTRLLVLLLLPLLAVLGAVYVAVERANTDNAIALINRDLRIGVDNFTHVIEDRNLNLSIAGDAVSRDYAVRQAFSLKDRPTLLSALGNLLERLSIADFIALNEAGDGALLADTHRPSLQGAGFEWQALIASAQELDRQGRFPEADDVVLVEGKPYHVTVLPFLTPDLTGWIALGFEMGDDFTAAFKETVAADLSVLYRDTHQVWQVGGSTLPAPLPARLAASLHGDTAATALSLAGEDYVTLLQPLSSSGDVQIVLQRSLTEQLAPFHALQQRLFTIFALGLIVLLAVLLLLARNVTRPLQLLTQGAHRIADGDYDQQVAIAHKDEIGQLATAFNAMALGLAEKERVRTLLGKVVSPAIANELLSKQPELGGEEREVTVLFTDVRGFTSLCEGRQPREILALLNEYFTMLAGIIESHHGVVDKYIGDAVMALFGAPLPDADAPDNAVAAALAVAPALAHLNESFAARGFKPIAMGIGIHCDRVVVGNMGSLSRLNYTAIGDGVNLASRLEGLCKRYGVAVVVSDSVRAAAPEYLYLPLDLVRVKGKQQPVRILAPLALLADASDNLQRATLAFDAFLEPWQRGEWQLAAAALDSFAPLSVDLGAQGHILLALYRARLQQFMNAPPAAWDGVFTFDDK